MMFIECFHDEGSSCTPTIIVTWWHLQPAQAPMPHGELQKKAENGRGKLLDGPSAARHLRVLPKCHVTSSKSVLQL